MKELFSLIFRFRLKALFVAPTTNESVRMFRYVFVGGIAFLADFGAFSLANLAFGDSDVGIAAANVVGFVIGLLVNFGLSKWLVFTEKARGLNGWQEFLAYAVIGAVGVGISTVLLLVAVRFLNKYLAKVIVSIIVLFYNYFARKWTLYRRGREGGTQA